MSNKGFGKQSDPDEMLVESLVSHRDMQPYVSFKWGKEAGKLTPKEAMDYANTIYQCATNATIDAQIVEFAMKKLDRTIEEALMLLRLFRQKRENSKLPSVTIRMGGEHLRPETFKQTAKQWLDIAFSTEAEAYLCGFLIEDLNLDGEQVDSIVQDFREMRGATTLWNQAELDIEEDES